MLPASAGLRCAPQNVAVAVTGGRSEKAAAEDSGSYNAAPLGKNANLGGSTESRPTDPFCRKFRW